MTARIIPLPPAVVVPPPILTTADWATRYAGAGLPPLAIRPNDKRPLATGWQAASLEDTLALLDANPTANIGIAVPAGLVVLDVDTKCDGPAVLDAFEFQNSKLPDTLRARTQSGGSHYVFKLPQGVSVRNAVAFAPGLDVRALGGYIVAAPSTIDGKAYRWENWGTAPAPIPGWLLTAMQSKKPATDKPRQDGEPFRIPDGQRNATLFAGAAAMRNKGFPPAAISAALAHFNKESCTVPLPDSELATIAASAAKYEPDTPIWQMFPEPGALPQGASLEKPAPRYKLLNSVALAALPPLQWRIRGVLPAMGLAALYGPSASGKSFLGFDMAAAIAEGQRWFGCRVESVPVVYAALEGEAGFKLRAQAWEAHHGRQLPERLHLVLQPFKLTEPQDVQDLAAVVPAGAVVFLDTLNRAAPTADENSSKDMGEILSAAKHLQSLTGGLVVLIHHTGKDATKGLRGHSSLFAAMDAAVEVSRDGDHREWSVAKSKDGADGDARPFKLQIQTLGIDEHGDPVSSCVVMADHAAQDVRRVKVPQGGNQRLVWDALRPLFKDGETGKPGAPMMRPRIDLESAVIAGAGRLTCDSGRRVSRARAAITGLVSRGLLGLNDGILWMR